MKLTVVMQTSRVDHVLEEAWRSLNVEYDDPYMNLAVEEAIARKVGEGKVPNTVRFWRNLNAVVIGYFQSVELEVNLEACENFGTTISRRFTGGGAVYQDHGNLNYAISIRKGHPLIPEDLTETFKILSSGTVEGLRMLGLKAEFKPLNDIQINGRKVSGAAGSIRWGTVFHHGSILVSSNLNILSKVLDAPNGRLEDKHVRSARRTVTTVRDELRRGISIDEVKEKIRKGIEEAYGIRLIEGILMKEEELLAEELLQGKYSTRDWNLGR